MRTAALLLALIPLVSCSGGGSDGAEVEVGPVVEASPPGGMGWEAEYEDPGDMLTDLRAGGVECETEAGSFSTVYSLRSLFCYTVETRDDGYTMSVYGSAEQQGEAHVHLTETNPGAQYVWGTGWSVGLPWGSDGSEVVAVLGGEIG